MGGVGVTTKHGMRQSRKTINITHPGIRQENYHSGTPATLPTSEPGTPQLSFTLTSGDFPSSNDCVLSQFAMPNLVAIAAGKNTSGVTATVLYRISVNSVSVETGSLSSVANNRYWSLGMLARDVKAGDVITIALWSSASNVIQNYESLLIVPVAHGRGLDAGKVVQDLSVSFGTGTDYVWTTTGINPNVVSMAALYPYNFPVDGSTVLAQGVQHAVNVPIARLSSLSGVNSLFRFDYGDRSSFLNSSSATYHPYVRFIPYPITKIEFTLTDLVLP